MFRVALKMLVGDSARFFGIVMGVTLACFVIAQQGSIFIGIMGRTTALINDTTYPDIWVMDPKVQYIDDTKPLQDTQLYRVRGVEGVAWAGRLYKGMIRARMENGTFQNCNLIGIEDSTLVGGPPAMVEGTVGELRRADAVIVDEAGATTRLARRTGNPEDAPIPLAVGDTLELNDRRAVVVGISKGTRTFQSQPMIYTTYSRAVSFAPKERKSLSFVLVGVKPGLDAQEVCKRIAEQTGLAAYTRAQFRWVTVEYYLKYTGIPINFGLAVGLGFLIGTVITGFMFYSFTLDNLRFLGTLKAMGTGDVKLLWMILMQALVVGLLGFGIGVGLASLVGWLNRGSALAFLLPWQLVVVAGAAVVVICMLSAMLSMRRVILLEPAVVFKG
ncbi:MAG: FtsX-like permease family protein [Phycisphaerales bacterium]|nr:FtsX-like permease family protein [Phycisphaerales bacterium]